MGLSIRSVPSLLIAEGAIIEEAADADTKQYR